MGVLRDDISFLCKHSAIKALSKRRAKLHIDEKIMGGVKPHFNAYVTYIDVKEYCFLHKEWFFGCCAKIKNLCAFDAVGSLWDEKRWVEEIDAGSCIEETYGSAHGYSDKSKNEAELVRLYATYCNDRRISHD